MKKSISIIQKQKHQLSSKLLPSMSILKMSCQELSSLIAQNIMDNPFTEPEVDVSDIGENGSLYSKCNNSDEATWDIPDERKNSLLDAVLPQLSAVIRTDKDEYIYRFLIESLDSSGYLKDDLEDIRKLLNIRLTVLKNYIQSLQRVEPKGLASKDLKECLLIQLEYKEQSNLAKIIVKKHLEQLSKGNLDLICAQENVAKSKVDDAVKMIKSLNPIPANGYSTVEKTIAIIPDVYIYKKDGGIAVDLNCSNEQRLKLNEDTYQIYRTEKLDSASKDYLKKKLNDVRYLKYCVTRRTITMKKIIAYLVNRQEAFFLTGNEILMKPTRLIDISNGTKLHISTICRALNEKYFQCDYGVYPLQFLMPKTYSKNGTTVAISLIRGEIKELVDSEDTANPLTDAQIQELLQEMGYSVSRRSVSVYREALSIPSSWKRKRGE